MRAYAAKRPPGASTTQSREARYGHDSWTVAKLDSVTRDGAQTSRWIATRSARTPGSTVRQRKPSGTGGASVTSVRSSARKCLPLPFPALVLAEPPGDVADMPGSAHAELPPLREGELVHRCDDLRRESHVRGARGRGGLPQPPWAHRTGGRQRLVHAPDHEYEP